MVAGQLERCKNALFVLENFCARFYQLFLVVVFLLGGLLHGVANVLGFLSVLGYFWGLLTLGDYFFQKKAEKLLVVLGILITSSFLLSCKIPFIIFVVFGLLGAYALFFGKGDFSFVRQPSSAGYFLLFFGATFFWGIRQGNFALMADNYHPFYEFGIGRCVEWGNWLSSWLPRDMAYLGGEVRYHFLATRLPFLFSYVARSDHFFSITFLIPAFFIFLFSILADAFKQEFSWAGSYEKRFIFLGMLVLAAELVVPSFGLGVALSLLVLVFVSRKSFFAGSVALLMLLLTKFTVFVVIFSSWGLFFCWQTIVSKQIDVKAIGTAFVTLILGAVLYLKFLGGAHGHCLWIAVPWILINPFRPHFLTQSAPFDLGVFIWIIMQVVIGIAVLGYAYRRREFLVAMLGACFSMGVLWRYFLLSEFVEGNNYHFTTLSGILFSILLLFLISEAGPFGSKNIYYSTLNACCQRLVYMCLKVWVTLRALWIFLLGATLPIKAVLMFVFMGIGNTTDMRSIAAWQFLESRHDKYGAIAGKHYEIGGRYSHDSDLPGDRGFLASGFSGKQLFAEGYCSRGIMMNSGYPERVAHMLVFFKKFVELSENSQDSFKNHFDSIEYLMLPAYPMSQSPSSMIRLLHKLSLGREWHRVNYEKKLYQEMQKIIVQLDSINDISYYIKYFKHFNMAYLVLEKGDAPGEKLLEQVDILYKNDAAMVLFFR